MPSLERTLVIRRGIGGIILVARAMALRCWERAVNYTVKACQFDESVRVRRLANG
jgi:hypothetical protein